MAVTNRYDTFKKYSKDQINAFRNTANRYGIKIKGNGTWTYYIDGKKVSYQKFEPYRKLRKNLLSTVNEWEKQASDYYKAFGSSMLAGSNVGVDSANVSVNEVPVDRTDPILEATSTPKRKKRGDGSASVLGL